MLRRKRFTSEKSAYAFAKKVGGKLNDCRNIETAKSPFTVTYKPNEKTRKHWESMVDEIDFVPEDDRDFSYPNDYWI